MLHPLSAFVEGDVATLDGEIDYWYEGRCPYSGQILRLPRTAAACAIATALMTQLSVERGSQAEGKMYGVLLVQTPAGDLAVLKAFSGQLDGQSQVEGWVPPILGREQVALEEAKTLAALDHIKSRLIELQRLPERNEVLALSEHFKAQLDQLHQRHQSRKQARQAQRKALQASLTGEALAAALAALDRQSQQDGSEKRRLKQERDQVLKPLWDAIAAADADILTLKRQRKALSQQLQAQMHQTYCLINFAGETRSIEALASGAGLPTGTGDCCAPKLLQYAAAHQLKPLAMAEFWWGAPSSSGDKLPGTFYSACEERCQPIMGFLLSGLNARTTGSFFPQVVSQEASLHPGPSDLTIVYQDAWLVAVNKPAGLLSVPGRYLHSQDSVLTRLTAQLSGHPKLTPAHRLDQDTSGILLLCCDQTTYRHLSQQFAARQVHKVYEAILDGALDSAIDLSDGAINLPLWGDPDDRPHQKVDWQRGKPSLTKFRVITSASNHTRIEFYPLTGRTHQLRVHAADPQGLGIPIRGDRLYGSAPPSTFLHLHARELHFQHPQRGQGLHLVAETLF